MQLKEQIRISRNLWDRFGLTPAEIIITDDLMEGLSPNQIAVSEHKSLNTIRGQVQTLREKFNSHTTNQLITKLYQEN